MRQMFSKKQIEEMISEAQLSEEQIAQVSEMLVGHYVRIMDAPESTTLTDEQIAQIKEGVFINGEFLSDKNPILLPSGESGSGYVGCIIGASSYYTRIRSYKIDKISKVISVITDNILVASNLFSVNGKTFPQYPSSTGTFVLKCVDGTLSWVEEA